MKNLPMIHYAAVMARGAGLAVVFVFIGVATAFADPPRNIESAFNGTQASISVYHPVSNGAVHYVDKVTVRRNNKPLAARYFTSQQSAYQNFTLELPGIVPGDSLAIRAHCNRWGTRTQFFTVK
jgi:hypothetical protein